MAAEHEHEGAHVLQHIVRLCSGMTHPGLQATVGGMAADALRQCEEAAKQTVKCLLQGFQEHSAGEMCIADSAWALNKVVLSNECARPWVRDAGGLAAIESSLRAFGHHNDMVNCCVWMTHALQGIPGIIAILRSPTFSTNVLRIAVDVSYEIYKFATPLYEQRDPEKEELFKCVMTILHDKGREDKSVLQSCCLAVEVLLHDDPNIVRLLADARGVTLLLDALQHADDNGSEALARAVALTVRSLSHHGTSAQQRLARESMEGEKVADKLVKLATRGAQTRAEEEAMIALAHWGGLKTVIEAMRTSSQHQCVVRGGLAAVAELVSPEMERQELPMLQDLLVTLIQLQDKLNAPDCNFRCTLENVVAIAKVVETMAHFPESASCESFHIAVKLLLAKVQNQSQELEDVVVASTEALGRMALAKQEWVGYLINLGATEVASDVIRKSHDRKLVKYSFWFAAALSGLKFVGEQIRVNKNRWDVVDAAFCTIIDIMDEDLEGEWVLSHQRAAAADLDRDMTSVFELVVEAMMIHSNSHALQYRGCHCIALLTQYVPREKSAHLIKGVSIVCAACRRHRFSEDIHRDAFLALRTLLRVDRNGPDKEIASQCKQEDVPSILKQTFENIDNPNECEYMEHGVFLIAVLSDVSQAIEFLERAKLLNLSVHGVKAIYQLCQIVPVTPYVARSVMQVLSRISQSPEYSNPTNELVVRFQQNAELLAGLLRGTYGDLG
mmetsp:Transcript_16252/g.35178  ORF Transcript_16252/g.35178 Transcript_16252/m.35178 type:complete len:728 (-) Transcript_16252:242-2425(-)|eukprot:CAMPEP_0206429040 /NCGR_PEP_ID=MMETSP0324_2-20121206/6007_1 /ASSEMBLY_ACC=CAM_ASM_000836 /TAXON_ID=2866 /ORGANISM="Crypthecodinium cohnii, Strain Seligo" /LENGTH=727 /DNA_ID=CAMNT_0053894651 /DNA_START=37 /DNA_END=2220 /DNA_ORIENTATION=-